MAKLETNIGNPYRKLVELPRDYIIRVLLINLIQSLYSIAQIGHDFGSRLLYIWKCSAVINARYQSVYTNVLCILRTLTITCLTLLLFTQTIEFN